MTMMMMIIIIIIIFIIIIDPTPEALRGSVIQGAKGDQGINPGHKAIREPL